MPSARGWKRLILIATLITSSYQIENWRGRKAWNAALEDAKATGFSLDYLDYFAEPVPNDLNAAKHPIFEPVYLRTAVHKEAWDAVIEFDELYDQAVANFPEGFIDYVKTDGMPWRVRKLRNQKPWLDGVIAEGPLAIDLEHWQAVLHSAPGFNWPTTEGAASSPTRDFLWASHGLGETLRDIGEAFSRPHCQWFPPDRSMRPRIGQFAQFSNWKPLCQLVLGRVVAHATQGEEAQAFRELDSLLKLGCFHDDASRGLRLLIVVNQSAVLQRLLAPLILEAPFSDAMLERLDERIRAIRLLDDGFHITKQVRAYRLQTIQAMMNREAWVLDQPNYFAKSDNPQTMRRLAPGWIPRGWYYQNLAALERTYQSHILPLYDPVTRRVKPALGDAGLDFSQIDHFFSGFGTPYKVLAKALASDGEATFFLNLGASAETGWNLIRTLIAVKRHALTHGEFPASLTELSLDAIAELPHDFLTGAPLRYEINDSIMILSGLDWKGNGEPAESISIPHT